MMKQSCFSVLVPRISFQLSFRDVFEVCIMAVKQLLQLLTDHLPMPGFNYSPNLRREVFLTRLNIVSILQA